jgi:O-antigen ligase
MTSSNPSATLSRVAAWAIIAICGLNLNGLMYMLLGVGQSFSVVLLLAAGYLILRSGGRALVDPTCRSFVIAILSYIAFGSFFSIFSSSEEPFKYLLVYLPSAAIILAIVCYLSGRELDSVLRVDLIFLKYILLGASGSVWFSDLLFFHYQYPPLAADRYSGFFGNPNEAGIVSVAAMAVVLAKPTKYVFFQLAHVFIITGALFFTFSKSSFLLFFVIIFFYCVLTQKKAVFAQLAFTSLVVFAGWEWIRSLIPELTLSQQVRVDQVLQLVTTGEVSNETTTGRTFLWNFAIDKISHKFPVAYGFGEFHYLEGGIRELGVWQGAHNTYLMVLGEAGFIAFVALVVANVRLLKMSLKYRSFVFIFFYFIILQWDMMSAHNILGLRFHNMLTGFCLGLILLLQRNTLPITLQKMRL